MWDDNKSSNIHVIGVWQGDGKKGGAEKAFEEIMAENVPNLSRDINLQIPEAE